MLVSVALNGANIMGRYLFGSPIFWAEEVMVYLTIWGVFIGMIAVAYKGEHLSMDLFSAGLRGKPRIALHVVITAVLAICCLFTAAQSWTVVRLFFDTGAVSASSKVPLVIPHSALLIGFTLISCAAVIGMRTQLKAHAAAMARGGDRP
ncbi:MAG: TRAP transporter small permease [Aquisalimonadaceae bacterium]